MELLHADLPLLKNTPAPTSVELCKKLLKVRLELYEAYHGCKFPEPVIQYAITKGNKLTGYNPDKTLSLLDRAGARSSMQGRSTVVTSDDIDAVI